MLSKTKRLNLKKDFVWVRAQSIKVETENLKLFLRKGENITPRVGIALTTAIFKKANLRNKARRIVSLAIEELYSQLPEGTNLIIMPKIGVLTSSKEDLIVELKNAKSLNLFN